MSNIKLLKGDCIKKLKELQDNSIDSVVTDPPYEIGFMGKGWDDSGIANNPKLWKEVLRVLKPGGHLLSFSHSRTYHRQAVAVEDAGFEIRDQIMWVYGSGFPKSHNVGNSIDKLNGAGNRGHAISSGNRFHPTTGEPRPNGEKLDKYEARTEQGKGWEGWGTALKPAHEPIVMARKPFKGTVAKNVLEYGTGGINVDECRVGNETIQINKLQYEGKDWYKEGSKWEGEKESSVGRFPANIIFDEEAGKILDEQSESASRFFYCPKASKKDRNDGLDIVEQKNNRPIGTAFTKDDNLFDQKVNNFHPTVKPTDLMAYLVRLVTPKGGVVLDPFMGSGSTGKASVREGMDFIGIEREKEYMKIAKTRIEHEQGKHKHREFFE